jgi:predicted lipase
MLKLLLFPLIWALQVPLIRRLETKPVGNQQIEYFKEILNFTRSAYCLDGLQTWNCPTCSQDLLVSDISLVGDYHSNTFGFLGYSQKLKSIIVSFRGTRNIKNWIQDLEFAKPDFPFEGAPENSKVHFGFLEAWTYLKPQVVEGVLLLVQKYPNSTLLITGHSLGGAISTLCSTDLYTSYPNLV